MEEGTCLTSNAYFVLAKCISDETIVSHPDLE